MAALSMFAQAQRIDVAFGLSSISAPAASAAASGNHQPQSLDGGAYLGGSVDALFFKNRTVGVQGEFNWKASKEIYLPTELNLPYRPIFWDVNAIWAPKLTKRLSLEMVAGVGAQNTRFYTGACSGSNCFASSNHLMADFGGGIKWYAWKHVFLRPEARLYLVNNNVEFTSAHALRYGASIGYTFR
jgi:hypothetical protein